GMPRRVTTPFSSRSTASFTAAASESLAWMRSINSASSCSLIGSSGRGNAASVTASGSRQNRKLDELVTRDRHQAREVHLDHPPEGNPQLRMRDEHGLPSC